MTIELSETERAQNVAFQTKTLFLQLQTQVKPSLQNILVLIEQGTEGLSKEAVAAAFGDNATKIHESIKTLLAVL